MVDIQPAAFSIFLNIPQSKKITDHDEARKTKFRKA